jgi:hypothetical protein
MIPFNSINGDRVYDADDVAAMMGSVITDGVHPRPGTSLQATAAGGWTIAIAPGRCAARGRLGINLTEKQLTLAAPVGALPRIDAVVIRCDLLSRDLTESIKQGAPSSTPLAPSLQRDESVWELCLAHVLVAPTAIAVEQSAITDTRQNAELCGVMNSLIQVDPAGLFAQYDDAWRQWFSNAQSEANAWKADAYDQFEEWLATVQDLLDENAEANLAGAIATLSQRADSLEANEHGMVYEIARRTETAAVEDWEENVELGLWQTSVACEELSVGETDVTIIIAPDGLRQPILGAGGAQDGLAILFATKKPTADVGFTMIVTGRRS